MSARSVRALLRRLHRDQAGGAMAEYGIIAAGLAIPAIVGFVAIIAAVSHVLSTTLNGLFSYMTR